VYYILNGSDLQTGFDGFISGEASYYEMLLPGSVAPPAALLLLVLLEMCVLGTKSQSARWYVLGSYFVIGLLFFLTCVLSIANVSIAAALYFGTETWSGVCTRVTGFKSNALIDLAGGDVDLGIFCTSGTIDADDLAGLALRVYFAQAVLLITAIVGFAIVAATSQGLYTQELIDDRAAGGEYEQEGGIQMSPLAGGKSHPKSPEHQKLDVNDSDGAEVRQF
jgi:hypothetical protein